MKPYTLLFSCVLFIALNKASAQPFVEILDYNRFVSGKGVDLNNTSFRGMSVVTDKVIWVSGSHGTFGKSTDGGKTFTFTRLSGYEKYDFRDIEAFDDERAVMMSSGTPAYILKTTDGGQTWKEVYKNTDTTYFLDAMDFWDDKRGMLVADPRNGHFVLLETSNGGESWQELAPSQTPAARQGEAVFAASGTSLRCWDKNKFGFVTGGSVANFHVYKSRESSSSSALSVPQGSPAKGAFSFCVFKDYHIVGGNYQFKDSTHNMVVVSKGMNSYGLSHFDYPYLSCIESLGWPGGFVMTGPNGVYTIEKQISSESFNVVRKAKKGSLVFMAGPKGKIGKLVW